MRIAIAGATGLIGSRLTALARAEGHDVVEIARETGFDLMAPDLEPVVEALAGVESVVDVTSTGAVLDEYESRRIFETVATHLGEAGTAAGVRRSVVLSIVGVDGATDYGYYRAKVWHETATRAHAPGARVLRATQFHDFARQMVEWNRDGDTTHVIDVPTQPVDTGEIVRLLLDLATGAVDHDVELAGPQEERLVDLAERYAAHAGLDLRVVPEQAPASLAAGAMLPGEGALRRGPDWATWLAAQPTSQPTTVRS
ncbi:hypothetical protein G5V58_24510 [Nocardioides anomalus]|uniref:NAD(P)H-binding protein n=1 Tax=Nocardioides anomalus TaxID=2712223 RepID=A0A6G6WJV8_9ACTN|nr:NAD(P)H-binding protein [Nocardioides anomalus]QIG45486.1 hypothetical protein G5V58_24510 [Nocardioides anomalus]